MISKVIRLVAQRLKVMWNYLFPVGMTAWNVIYFVYGLVAEGRIKVNALRFVVLYGATIPASFRGDMTPFYLVLSSSPD